ncbi:MAG: hypothetical protein SPF60_11010 [Lachnospiraceae bacterium]|nr:hypothetical protein [Lachnospiraceae bacterium]
MKKTEYKKQKIVIGIFLFFLFVMLIGIVGPMALRRAGLLKAGETSYVQEEPDERQEPVNFAQTYPFEEEIQESKAAESFYDRLKSKEASLKGLIRTVETYSDEHVPGRTAIIEAYIKIQKLLGSRIIDGDDVVVKLDNGQLTFLSDRLSEADAAACASNLVGFAEFAEELGADFLYVQTPNKINKYDNQLPEGLEDFANSNADGLTAALREANVPVLDLRDRILEDLDFDSAFYVSDHHWKPRTGLWAAGEILSELNLLYGAGLDEGLLDTAQYDETVYPDIFLGALGKKTGKGYVPLDDMSILTPRFDTDFTMKIVGSGYTYHGDFTHAFIDESQLEPGDYYTKNPYAAYFRDDQALVEVTNHKLEEGKKVLLLKDSFGLSTAPFLSTAIRQLDVIDLRYFNGSLKRYVEESCPDIIVVMYNPKAITAPTGYHADLFDFR